MSITRFLVHDVTIVRAAGVEDDYGNQAKDWAAATRTPTKAWVVQTGALEDRQHREAQLGQWFAYFPAGVDVTGRDRVEWGDRTFEVAGPPTTANTPRGPHHIEARLELVEG